MSFYAHFLMTMNWFNSYCSMHHTHVSFDLVIPCTFCQFIEVNICTLKETIRIDLFHGNVECYSKKNPNQLSPQPFNYS
jgi:hypothetical protein